MSGKFWLVLEEVDEGGWTSDRYYEAVSKHPTEDAAKNSAAERKRNHPHSVIYVAAVTHRVELTPDFHTTG